MLLPTKLHLFFSNSFLVPLPSWEMIRRVPKLGLDPMRVGVNDTQIDSIQYLNFAKKWFNSIFNSILFHKNSIQKIIQFKKFQKNPIQKIIQINKWGSTDIGWIMINHEYHIFYGILGHYKAFWCIFRVF
jgi:hypothetical protein